MTPCCVDASIAVKWAVLEEPFRSKALAFLHDAGIRGIKLIAPPYFPGEVDSAVRKRVYHGKMSIVDAQKAYTILDVVPVQIVDLPDLRRRAREIAAQFNQRTVYDAAYAALAELRQCEFWTADKAFYEAVKAELSFVKYLADYT